MKTKSLYKLILFIFSPIIWAQESYDFEILINGKPVGHYMTEVNTIDNEIHVTTDILIRIRFLFIPLFRLTNHSTERWVDNCLDNIRSLTSYGPRDYVVEGNVVEDNFIVHSTRRGETTETILESCPHALAFWSSDLLQINEIINPFNGRNEEASFQDNEVIIESTDVIEKKLILDDDEFLLYYDSDGRWVGLKTTARNRLIEFVPSIQTLNKAN